MKILACVDGSQFASSVCDYAAWSAKRLGASVEVLHLIERHPQIPATAADHSGRLGLDTSEALLQELAAIDEQRNRLAQERGRILLEHAADRLREAGVDEVLLRLAQGNLAQHLKTHDTDARMIVIGRRGEAEDPGKHHLGRNLEGVIRSVRRPVLVAPGRFAPINRYLLAYDGGRSAAAIVDFLQETRLLADAEGKLLFVGEESSDAGTRVLEVSARLQSAGFTVTPSIRNGDPEDTILGTLEDEGFDVLVMGAFGHSRIRELILGSTTTEMLQRTATPVLVVH